MSDKPTQYKIYWKNKQTAQSGMGTTKFDREKADQLVEELNRDYPHIEHQAVEVE